MTKSAVIKYVLWYANASVLEQIKYLVNSVSQEGEYNEFDAFVDMLTHFEQKGFYESGVLENLRYICIKLGMYKELEDGQGRKSFEFGGKTFYLVHSLFDLIESRVDNDFHELARKLVG